MDHVHNELSSEMNGIDIKKLRKAISILEKDPDKAIFTFPMR